MNEIANDFFIHRMVVNQQLSSPKNNKTVAYDRPIVLTFKSSISITKYAALKYSNF